MLIITLISFQALAYKYFCTDVLDFRGKHDAYKIIEGMTENDTESRFQLSVVIDSLKLFPNKNIEKLTTSEVVSFKFMY